MHDGSGLDGAWALQNGGDPTRLGVTGFCRGGRNTWLYAAHSPTAEGGGRLVRAARWAHQSESSRRPRSTWPARCKCPLLGLYGGQDTGIPVADVQAAAAKAKAAGKTVEIVIYPDAPHGFHADYRPSYRQADAEDGWKRMLAWFKKYGVG